MRPSFKHLNILFQPTHFDALRQVLFVGVHGALSKPRQIHVIGFQRGLQGVAHRIRPRVGAGGIRPITHGRSDAASTSSAPKNSASHEVREVGVGMGVMGMMGVVILVLVVVAGGRRRCPTPPWSNGDLVLFQGHELLQVHSVAGRALAGAHQLNVGIVNL